VPRLFTAIELAPETRAAVVRQQAALATALRREGTPVRLTPPDQLHLTLVFIGQVDEARAREIVEAMRADLPAAPFELEFGSAGVFPPRGRARILWLGVSRGARDVTELYAQVVERLESAGVPREARPYSPHLTIGRWRNDDGPRRTAFPPVPAQALEHVNAVTLFESRLQSSGAEHVPLVRCRLGGAGVDPLH
jgi:2'-5' RNA ligase